MVRTFSQLSLLIRGVHSGSWCNCLESFSVVQFHAPGGRLHGFWQNIGMSWWSIGEHRDAHLKMLHGMIGCMLKGCSWKWLQRVANCTVFVGCVNVRIDCLFCFDMSQSCCKKFFNLTSPKLLKHQRKFKEWRDCLHEFGGTWKRCILHQKKCVPFCSLFQMVLGEAAQRDPNQGKVKKPKVLCQIKPLNVQNVIKMCLWTRSTSKHQMTMNGTFALESLQQDQPNWRQWKLDPVMVPLSCSYDGANFEIFYVIETKIKIYGILYRSSKARFIVSVVP